MAQKPKQSTSNGIITSDDLMNTTEQETKENKCKFQNLNNHYLASLVIDGNNHVNVKYCSYITSEQIRQADMEQSLRNMNGENNSDEDLRKASREVQPPFIAAVQATKEHKGILIVGHTDEVLDDKQIEERLNNRLWVNYIKEQTENYDGGPVKTYEEVTGGKSEPLTSKEVEFLNTMAEMQ